MATIYIQTLTFKMITFMHQPAWGEKLQSYITFFFLHNWGEHTWTKWVCATLLLMVTSNNTIGYIPSQEPSFVNVQTTVESLLALIWRNKTMSYILSPSYICWLLKEYRKFLTPIVMGADSACTLFRHLFLNEKNYMTFTNSL